jgi:hypothetical protein
MTPEQITAILALCDEIEAADAAATEGPWGQEDEVNDHCLITAGTHKNGSYRYVVECWEEEDIPLVILYRTAAPKLARLVREMLSED